MCMIDAMCMIGAMCMIDAMCMIGAGLMLKEWTHPIIGEVSSPAPLYLLRSCTNRLKF